MKVIRIDNCAEANRSEYATDKTDNRHLITDKDFCGTLSLGIQRINGPWMFTVLDTGEVGERVRVCLDDRLAKTNEKALLYFLDHLMEAGA